MVQSTDVGQVHGRGLGQGEMRDQVPRSVVRVCTQHAHKYLLHQLPRLWVAVHQARGQLRHRGEPLACPDPSLLAWALASTPYQRTAMAWSANAWSANARRPDLIRWQLLNQRLDDRVVHILEQLFVQGDRVDIGVGQHTAGPEGDLTTASSRAASSVSADQPWMTRRARTWPLRRSSRAKA